LRRELVFRRSADAVEYACKNGQKVIKVFMRPDRAALNLNRIPTIPALLSEFLKTSLEHVATYKQNGNSTVYFAEFRTPEMAALWNKSKNRQKVKIILFKVMDIRLCFK
jgi:hypothetical protein